ncbi:hypothetical protein Btru_050501 [Bulinus truncatus]|nr:hypothetical protein Btru_050501 [Bulinus truncatus]
MSRELKENFKNDRSEALLELNSPLLQKGKTSGQDEGQTTGEKLLAQIFPTNPTQIITSQHQIYPDGANGFQHPTVVYIVQDSNVSTNRSPINQNDIQGTVQGTKCFAGSFVLSVFVLFCCCLPLGLVSLIMTFHAQFLTEEGRHQEAQKNATRAKYVGIVGFIIGLSGNNILATVILTRFSR